MKETFDRLGTDVHDWHVGKYGNKVWPRRNSPKVCQLCGYKYLVYHYWLFNDKKFITIQVGSECVHNWVELKYQIRFVKYLNKLMVKSFRPWLNVFFPEYRTKKHLTTFSKKDTKLSVEMYDFSKSSYKDNPKKVKRIYKKAQKLGYTLPPELFGYGIFDEKEKKRYWVE